MVYTGIQFALFLPNKMKTKNFFGEQKNKWKEKIVYELFDGISTSLSWC